MRPTLLAALLCLASPTSAEPERGGRPVVGVDFAFDSALWASFCLHGEPVLGLDVAGCWAPEALDGVIHGLRGTVAYRHRVAFWDSAGGTWWHRTPLELRLGGGAGVTRGDWIFHLGPSWAVDVTASGQLLDWVRPWLALSLIVDVGGSYTRFTDPLDTDEDADVWNAAIGVRVGLLLAID